MKILTVLSFAFLLTTLGCKNSAPNSPQVVTGDLKGTVGLIDSHGNEIFDRSGVLIQAEGTTLTAISDSAGNWIIHNLPSQTFSISFSKNGYGTLRNTSYSFLGGGTVLYGNRVYLYQPVTFTIALDSVSAVFDSMQRYGDGYLSGHISGAVLADSAIIQAYVLEGYSPNLVFEDTTTFFGGELFNDQRHTLHKKGSDLIFNSSGWEVCGPSGWAKHGMTVYLQAFAITSNYSPQYYDVIADKWIYPNPVPSSNVIAVTIP